MNMLKNFIVESGIEILETVSIASREILIIIGMVALILYLFGYKKFKTLYEAPIVKEKDEQAMNKLKMLISPFILKKKKPPKWRRTHQSEIPYINVH